ncbi:ABC transporter transmembrane domain-containing protein [Vibrio sinaloensis]|nr:ABC transporter transmembrane domain-containing protein [Vibrio sinaloensis]
MAATAAESIGAIQSVQALKIEDRFGNIFRQANSKSLKEGVKGKKLVASLQRTVEILVAISTALVLTFGSLEVLAGHLTPRWSAGLCLLFTPRL